MPHRHTCRLGYRRALHETVHAGAQIQEVTRFALDRVNHILMIAQVQCQGEIQFLSEQNVPVQVTARNRILKALYVIEIRFQAACDFQDMPRMSQVLPRVNRHLYVRPNRLVDGCNAFHHRVAQIGLHLEHVNPQFSGQPRPPRRIVRPHLPAAKRPAHAAAIRAPE